MQTIVSIRFIGPYKGQWKTKFGGEVLALTFDRDEQPRSYKEIFNFIPNLANLELFKDYVLVFTFPENIK